MRRKQRQVTDLSEIEEIIKNCPVCRIALNSGGAPYIVPLSFGYRLKSSGQLSLYFHCAGDGRKNLLLKENPLVGFEMDRMLRVTGKEQLACTYTCRYESVIGTGTAEFITEPQDKQDALCAIMEHQTMQAGFVFDSHVLERTSVFRVVSTDFTAKQNKG